MYARYRISTALILVWVYGRKDAANSDLAAFYRAGSGAAFFSSIMPCCKRKPLEEYTLR
jgi:hypothetical protein